VASLRQMFARITGGDPDDVQPGEVGSDSTAGAWMSDWLTDDRDDHPELLGRERYLAYDSMAIGDPIIAGLEAAVIEPLVAAEYTMRPAAEDPVARVVADACAWQFGLRSPIDKGRDYSGQLDVTWRHLIRQLLMFLHYGSHTAELVWSDDLVDWVDLDGDTHLIKPLARIAPRWPHSLERYQAPRLGSGLALGGVHQDGVKRVLPGEKLIHLVLKPWASRWTGSSLIRPAYSFWKLKKQLLVSSAIGYDRHAAGTPKVRYPRNGDRGDAQKAARIGRSIRSHERAYVRFPGPPPSDTNPNGWDLEIINGAQTLADPIPLLRHYDQQIVSAGLANFLSLGVTESGSRAVGSELSEPYYISLNGVAKDLVESLTRQLVKRWVAVNFGPGIEPPELVVSRIASRNLSERGEFVSRISDAGVRVDDRDAQDALRDAADLPPLAEDEPEAQEGTPLRPGAPAALDAIAGAGRADPLDDE
jgi:hypothetical protein